jgi:hypothetical protein
VPLIADVTATTAPPRIMSLARRAGSEIIDAEAIVNEPNAHEACDSSRQTQTSG